MVLQVETVSKDFGGLRALNKVSMSIEEGKITALIGPNGAGKTTLFNIIAGVYGASEGSVFFHGKPIDRLSTHERVELGIARSFQLAKLFRRMTVLENVMVGRYARTKSSALLPIMCNLPRVHREERETYDYAMEMLKLSGIEDLANEVAANLPHGQQRLLEMTRAMATGPKLVLLDEPAAGLNPHEEDLLKESLKTFLKRGTTILLVEHDMRFVMNISNWIYVLDFGNKIAEGTPEEIGRNPEAIKAYLGKEA